MILLEIYLSDSTNASSGTEKPSSRTEARAVPISQEMQDEIFAHHAKYRDIGAIFISCTGAFKEAIERAGIQLPLGQLTHVLHHTFASHFIINGGSILTLQRVLGHQDLKTTMRYAHLAPDYLESVRSLNPLFENQF